MLFLLGCNLKIVFWWGWELTFCGEEIRWWYVDVLKNLNKLLNLNQKYFFLTSPQHLMSIESFPHSGILYFNFAAQHKLVRYTSFLLEKITI